MPTATVTEFQAAETGQTAPTRRLVTSGPPDADYPVPGEERFGDKELGEEVVDFLPAGDLEHIGAALIRERRSSLSHLADCEVTYLWKREGGKAKGKETLGAIQKPSGLLKYFAESTFVVWLAADHCRTGALTAFQVEALLFRQLCSTGTDETNGKPVLLPPDFQGYCAELRGYGAWESDLRQMARTVRQMPLFDGE